MPPPNKLTPSEAEELKLLQTSGEDLELQELKKSMPKRGFKPQDESLWGSAEHFASGILQGTGDEVKAFGAAVKESMSPGGLDFGNAYDQAKSVYQNARKNYTEKNKGLATALDMTGQTLPWLAATPLLPIVGPVASTLQKIKTGAKIGLGSGFVSGGLNAEGDLIDRAKGAGVGGVLGTILGGASGPVVDLAVKGGKGLIGALTNSLPFKQRSIAERKIAEALYRDGFTPESAVAKLKELGPSARLIDLGENIRDLGGSVVQTPGRGKSALTKALTRRQEGIRNTDKILRGGQGGRIIKMLDDLVPENFYQTRAGLEQQRKSMGKGYDAARDGGDLVDTSKVIANLDDEIANAKGGVKSNLQTIRSYLHDENGNPEITIRTLHNAKIAIDDLMTGEAKTSMGKVSKSKIWSTERGLVDAIEESGESGAAYNASRLGTASSWSKQEAMEQGANFLRKTEFKNPTELKLALEKMKPEQLHGFRIGMVQELKDKLGDSIVRADSVKKMMDIKSLEEKILLGFGDPELFKRYIQGLEGEKAMFKSYSKMFGSPTAKNLAAIDDARIDPSRLLGGIRQMASPNPWDWMRGAYNTIGGVKDRVSMPEGLSNRLAMQLLGRNTQQLTKPYKSAVNTDNIKRQLARSLAAGSGGSQ
tara:strand:+ start:624 stop:2570 length:1947 start_codon:yes stop_codon:yes gene_type:complete